LVGVAAPEDLPAGFAWMKVSDDKHQLAKYVFRATSQGLDKQAKAPALESAAQSSTSRAPRPEDFLCIALDGDVLMKWLFFNYLCSFFLFCGVAVGESSACWQSRALGTEALIVLSVLTCCRTRGRTRNMHMPSCPPCTCTLPSPACRTC